MKRHNQAMTNSLLYDKKNTEKKRKKNREKMIENGFCAVHKSKSEKEKSHKTIRRLLDSERIPK